MLEILPTLSYRPFKPSGTMIPTELAFLVVENLTSDDAPTLARLARCSSAFHSICIPRLYNHIHIYKDRQFVHLLQGLSIEMDRNGEPLPCPTLTELVVSHVHDDGGPPLRLYGTRKLAQFGLTRHITLHYRPDYPAIYQIDRVSQPSGDTFVQMDGGSGPLLKPVIHLFPSVQGLILGKGYILETISFLSKLNPCDSDEDCLEDTHDSQPRVSFLPYRNGLFPSPKTCFNQDDIPELDCVYLQSVTHRYLANNNILNLNISACSTHSTCSTNLRYSSVCHTPEANRMRYHVDVSNGSATPKIRDNIHDSQIEKVWNDLYCITESTVEDLLFAEITPLRRDIIISGMSESEVRALEQRFVTHVEEMMFSEHQVTVDRDDNLAGLRRLGTPDPGAQRVQGRKRVIGFDFIHAASAAHCVCCGKGGSGVEVAEVSGFSVKFPDMWF